MENGGWDSRRIAGLGEAERTNRVSGSDLFLARRHSSTACFRRALLLVAIAIATEDINPVTNHPASPPLFSLSKTIQLHSETWYKMGIIVES